MKKTYLILLLLAGTAIGQDSWYSWDVVERTVTKTLDTTYIYFKPAFGAAKVTPDTTVGKLPPQYVAAGQKPVTVGIYLVSTLDSTTNADTDSIDLIVKPVIRIGNVNSMSGWRIVHNDSTRIGANATADVISSNSRAFTAVIPATATTITASGYAFIHKWTSGKSGITKRVGFYLGTPVY